MPPHHEVAFAVLKKTLDSYWPITGETWERFTGICRLRELRRGELLYRIGDVPPSFAFVFSGLFRLFVIDEKGSEYNKNFFEEGAFPGCMTALLTNAPSRFAIDALEPSTIIEIDFTGFRKLLLEAEDLKLFQIHYLEKNWLLDKDAREVALVQEDAAARYERFLRERPGLAARLPQYHIASHLGVTPTQLSRIRKKSGSSTYVNEQAGESS